MPPTSFHRRRSLHWLGALLASAAAAPAWAQGPAPHSLGASPSAQRIPLEVWKDPQCGCCADWVVHIQANGFDVTVHDTGNVAVRAQLGLPAELGSCHTALVGGYVVEGHVPAADVHKLLQQKPKALGITVPGMPVGGPGMDGPIYEGRKDPYDVLLVTKQLIGSGVRTRVFTSYRA